jgi:hypothetical protein
MKAIKTMFFSVLVIIAGSVNAAPFGEAADVQYSKDLWKAMSDAAYVGEGSIMSRAYTGQHPHGAILDTLEGPIALKGKLHHIIIKRNYGGPGVSIDTVSNDPAKYLKAVTVMLIN